MPKVSVFIPSYNHAPFIAAAVDSVWQQTYRDFELVVTDDGSTDGTAEILRNIGDARLRLNCFPGNRGAAVATNDAVRRCGGELLTLLNSDDVFMPQKLERQVAFLDAHPEVGAVFAYPSFIDEKGIAIPQDSALNGRLFDVENRNQAAWLRQFFFRGNCLCHPTMMIRRECYEKIGLYDARLAALPDLHLWIRLVSHFQIHVMPERLTCFRQLPNHANASSARVDNYLRFVWENALVLKPYPQLSKALFRETFAPELSALALDLAQDQRLLLGRICIATGNPVLHRLGLDLLFDALPEDLPPGGPTSGFSHADFHRHASGARDVFNLLALARVGQLEAALAARA